MYGSITPSDNYVISQSFASRGRKWALSYRSGFQYAALLFGCIVVGLLLIAPSTQLVNESLPPTMQESLPPTMQESLPTIQDAQEVASTQSPHDPESTLSKGLSSTPVILHDDPGGTASYEWCFDCPSRCDNVQMAIKNNNVDISEAARNAKFAHLATNIGVFYRGTDHLYLEDFFHQSEEVLKYTNEKTRCFVDADQHINNFGTFQDENEQILYDLNDFDQALVGQYLIDVFRLGASIVMQMTSNGLNETDHQAAIHALSHSYAHTLHKLEGNQEDNFQLSRSNTYGLIHDLLMDVEMNTAKYSRKAMLDKYTVPVEGVDGYSHRQLNLDRDDLGPVDAKTTQDIFAKWDSYVSTIESAKQFRNDAYTIKHLVAARLGAGVGSSGNTRWYVLVEGPTLSQDDDYILDVKHEPTPEWYWHVPEKRRQELMQIWASEGQRVANGFRAMNGRHADAFLGWLEMGEPYGSFVVKQRPPHKGSLKYESVTELSDWLELSAQWGVVLATNHARGDNDYDPTAVPHSFEAEFINVLDGDFVGFDASVWSFSRSYNKRVQGDFQCFKDSSLVA